MDSAGVRRDIRRKRDVSPKKCLNSLSLGHGGMGPLSTIRPLRRGNCYHIVPICNPTGGAPGGKFGPQPLLPTGPPYGYSTGIIWALRIGSGAPPGLPCLDGLSDLLTVSGSMGRVVRALDARHERPRNPVHRAKLHEPTHQ